ncbi:hypothetical protein HYG77_35400 (plasmid) [Rhodococcus sp. ZPP]|nr:hypothetical protein HYG77_35400 [Rhodococcus sp. ZPP]
MGRNFGFSAYRAADPGQGARIGPICQISVTLGMLVVSVFSSRVSMNLRGGRDRAGSSVMMTASSAMVEPREAPADPTTARRLVTRTPACRFAGGRPPYPGLNVVGEGGGGGGVRAEGWRGRR